MPYTAPFLLPCSFMSGIMLTEHGTDHHCSHLCAVGARLLITTSAKGWEMVRFVTTLLLAHVPTQRSLGVFVILGNWKYRCDHQRCINCTTAAMKLGFTPFPEIRKTRCSFSICSPRFQLSSGEVTAPVMATRLPCIVHGYYLSRQ